MDSNVQTVPGKNPFKGIKGKDVILSFQHMFAMLGATVLVPILAHMSVAVALIAAGIGTICFYFITKRKVPVFLGSSFAFLPALTAVITCADKYTELWNQQMLAASLSIVIAGLVYVVLSVIIKFVGVTRIKKLFPPIVVGPIIIVIGMILAPKMFYNNIISQYSLYGSVAWKEWTTAIITALTIICVNAFSKPKSFLKVIPILLGFIVGYIYAACVGLVSFANFDWTQIVIFQNLDKEFGFYTAFSYFDWSMFGNAVIMIVPLALVTFMEHMGDVSANSTICKKDFMVDPGLNRTVMGDGVATMVAGVLGAPANTTYGENTAVLAMTQNYNPRNIFLAACMAIVFGIFSIFGNLISTIPQAVIGGASIVLFGMISASGLRALLDAKVDLAQTKNLIIVSVVLSVGLGLGSMSLAGDITGNAALKIMAGNVEISPLALSVVIGVILNLIIPNSKEEPHTPDTVVDLSGMGAEAILTHGKDDSAPQNVNVEEEQADFANLQEQTFAAAAAPEDSGETDLAERTEEKTPSYPSAREHKAAVSETFAAEQNQNAANTAAEESVTAAEEKPAALKPAAKKATSNSAAAKKSTAAKTVAKKPTTKK